jgi:hypothetical protein
MSKSRLSTADIKRLRRVHVGLDLIAELAGITPNGVRYRLHPKSERRTGSYRLHASPVRQSYIAQQRQRQQDYQRQSLEHATHFGEWTTAEIRFVEKNAPRLTLVELATHLKRTYYSVGHYVSRHGIRTHH